MKNLSIKTWAEEDRPREKLILNGRTALSNAELLAIIIGSVTQQESAVELCRQLLHVHNNDLGVLARASVADLKQVHGIGEARAVSIMAALELGRRRRHNDEPTRSTITSSMDVYHTLRDKFEDLPHEEFRIILINRANKVISAPLISKGGISGTVADVRLMMKHALENLASGLVLAHNHPSGNLKPSEQDIRLTRKVKEAAALMEVQLLDHLIFTDTGYYSFSDEGII